MNFGSVPKIPTAPAIPQAPAVPTHLGQDVGVGPAQGNVGIGAPQHFDPNNPSVRLDGTVHNPTGVGGDLKVSREVSVNDLKQIPVPDVHAPDLSLPSGASDAGGSSGGGFSMPSIGNPLSGLSMPSLPDMPSMPSLPSMPSMPDMPSLGNPFSEISAPDLSLPSMPDFGNPFSGLSGPDVSLPDLPSMGTPGMPGFRFLELPDLPDIELDLSEWDLLPSFDIPDWEGDSESERQKPDTRAKKTDKVKVEIRLETEEGVAIPKTPFQIIGPKGFRFSGNVDDKGCAVVEVPRGEYEVKHPDKKAMYFRAVAATLHDAIATSDQDRFCGILELPRSVLTDLVAEYDLLYGSANEGRFRQAVQEAAKKFGIETQVCIRLGEAGLIGGIYNCPELLAEA